MPEAVARKRKPRKPNLKQTLTEVVGAGLQVERVERDRDGRIVIVMAGRSAEPTEDLTKLV